ncbi:conserved domain protein [Actinomyces sp. oral taxon 175 str. F0384]|nr:conserved domain protein [Actinomyces sp. oral taxon 175 str. F0384]
MVVAVMVGSWEWEGAPWARSAKWNGEGVRGLRWGPPALVRCGSS